MITEGSTVIILDEKAIKEFEEFVLQIPGVYCNPILAKFSTYKRVVKANPEKTEHFSDTGKKMAESEAEQKDHSTAMGYGPEGEKEIIKS